MCVLGNSLGKAENKASPLLPGGKTRGTENKGKRGGLTCGLRRYPSVVGRGACPTGQKYTPFAAPHLFYKSVCKSDTQVSIGPK